MIVIIGGDGRGHDIGIADARVRTFPSSRYGGNGSLRRAIAAIDSGTVDVVVLLVRWLGHTEFHLVVAACAAAGIPVVVVAGGLSAARRQVRKLLSAGVQRAS